MHSAAGQLPYQPCLNGSKKETAFFGFLPGAFHMIQNPFQFCPAEIRVNQKSCLLADQLLISFFLQRIADICRSSALPDDRIADRDSRFPVPDHRRLPLIGNSDGLDIPICTVYL